MDTNVIAPLAVLVVKLYKSVLRYSKKNFNYRYIGIRIKEITDLVNE